MAELSEEQVAELRQAFDMFDRDKGGSISTKELGYTMRAMGTYCSRVILSLCRLLSLGMNPTEAEILDLLCEVRGGGVFLMMTTTSSSSVRFRQQRDHRVRRVLQHDERQDAGGP